VVSVPRIEKEKGVRFLLRGKMKLFSSLSRGSIYFNGS